MKMTNEEAIHFLMNISHYVEYIDGRICVRAPLMDATLLAIKALLAQQHGHWIIKGRKLECSCCGKRVYIGTDDPGIFDEEKKNMKYCSGCGARMIQED